MQLCLQLCHHLIIVVASFLVLFHILLGGLIEVLLHCFVDLACGAARSCDVQCASIATASMAWKLAACQHASLSVANSARLQPGYVLILFGQHASLRKQQEGFWILANQCQDWRQ